MDDYLSKPARLEDLRAMLDKWLPTAVPRNLLAGPLIEESLRLLRPALPSSLLTTTEFAPDTPLVLIDAGQLQQVITNLVLNARDELRGTGHIHLATARRRLDDVYCHSCHQQFGGDFTEISVRDDGSGMLPAVLERAFEPFFTTKDVGLGSGLGLAMVHGIVHERSGHIVVVTAPQQGADIRVYLPVAPTEDMDTADDPASAARQASHPGRGRILIVDDEPAVAYMLAIRLEQYGYDPVVCVDPLLALERLDQEHGYIDLVICDVTMPGLTGDKLARLILQREPQLPVVLSTGFSDHIDAGTIAGIGVQALVRKPFDFPELLAILRTCLSGKSRKLRASARQKG